jgi:hypothetical protein
MLMKWHIGSEFSVIPNLSINESIKLCKARDAIKAFLSGGVIELPWETYKQLSPNVLEESMMKY